VKTARQISKLFAHDIALSNIIRGVKEVREWLAGADPFMQVRSRSPAAARQ